MSWPQPGGNCGFVPYLFSLYAIKTRTDQSLFHKPCFNCQGLMNSYPVRTKGGFMLVFRKQRLVFPGQRPLRRRLAIRPIWPSPRHQS
jgi:hypothetical protein